jgi:SAM-dependent methyltransferase
VGDPTEPDGSAGGANHRSAQPPKRLGSLYRAQIAQCLQLHRIQGRRALDVGGFDGFWASHLPITAIVLDLNPIPSYQVVQYVAGDALSLPFLDSAFDVVYAFDVIEHVADERTLIVEGARVLRPGGKLVLTTPDSDIRITPRFLQRWVDRKWGHYRVRGFEPGYLDHVLRQAGLRNVRVRTLSAATWRRRYLALSLLWRIWPGAGARWTLAAASGDAAAPDGPNGWLVASAVK